MGTRVVGRSALLALLLVGLLGACQHGAPPKKADPTPYGIRLASGRVGDSAKERARTQRYVRERRAGVVALLAKRSAAVLHHDRAAFLATVDTRSRQFAARQEQLYQGLAQLPLAAWSYEVAPDEHAYPPRPTAYATYHGDVFAPAVTLRLQLTGFDSAPVARPQVYTFVQRDGHWLIASDSDYDETLVVDTKQDPWDVGPVAVVRTAHALVVGSKRDAADLPRIGRSVDQAVAAVSRYWPTGWNHRAVVEVSRNPKVFGTLLLGDAAPEDVGALAVPQFTIADQYTVDRTTPVRPVGSHVVVNPAVLDHPDALPLLLTHEVTHVATRSATGFGTPTWLSEGYAEHVAKHGLGAADEVGDGLYALVDKGTGPTWLPSAEDFAMTHGELEYDEAWLACEYTASRWGEARLATLYRALGRNDDPALASERTDTAMRSVLGVSQQAFVAGWRRYVRAALS